MKTAISYTRFSTPSQALGDSESRQLDLTNQWCERNGYRLDTSQSIKDRGLSGFKKEHINKGELGVFLKALEAGKVKADILIVENIDRLSRRPPVETLSLLNQIVERIPLVILQPCETLFTPESIERLEVLMIGLFESHRAHGESARKKVFSTRNWQKKWELARKGEVVTKNLPSWIEIKSGKMALKKEPTKTIRQIAKWKLEGVTVHTICRQLNETKTPTISGRGTWATGTIGMLMNDPRVCGDYIIHQRVNGMRIPTDEKLKDYFPPVLDRETFARLKRLKKNGGSKPKNGIVGNLWSGLMRCDRCGSCIRYTYMINKSNPVARKYHYMVCDGACRGLKCEYKTIQYSMVEKTLLTFLTDQIGTDEITGSQTAGELLETQEEISELQGKIDLWSANIEGEDETASVKILMKKIDSHDAQIKVLRVKEAELLEAMRLNRADRLQAVKELIGRMQTLTGDKLNDLKIKLKNTMAELIQLIRFDPHSRVFHIWFHSGLVRTLMPQPDGTYGVYNVEYSDPDQRREDLREEKKRTRMVA